MNTKKKEHLIVDCDGVLLDPVLGFFKWFLLRFPNIDIVKILKSNENFFNYCIELFYESDDFKKIPMIKSAKNPILYLKDYYKLDVVTSCGSSQKIKQDRISNLEKLYGKNTFNEIHILPLAYSKQDIYSNYEKQTIIIDDEITNIKDAEDIGYTNVYLMKYYPFIRQVYYNSSYNKTNRKKPNYNWNQIVSIIKQKHLQK